MRLITLALVAFALYSTFTTYYVASNTPSSPISSSLFTLLSVSSCPNANPNDNIPDDIPLQKCLNLGGIYLSIYLFLNINDTVSFTCQFDETTHFIFVFNNLIDC